MEFSAGDNKYLETEVFTAPPQKLQLMLIEGAIRLVERGRQQWQTGETGRASDSLLQAQEIVEELITGMNRDANPALVDQVAAIYLFVADRLRTAHTERSDEKLQDVLRILQIERETWRQVCAQLAGQGSTLDQFVSVQDTERTGSLPSPHLWGGELAGDLPTTGFSLEV